MFIEYMDLFEQYSYDVIIAVVSKFDDVPRLTSLRFTWEEIQYLI